MTRYNSFFFGAALFLAGVFSSSVGIRGLIFVIFAILFLGSAGVFLIAKNRACGAFVFLAPFLLFGAIFWTKADLELARLKKEIPEGKIAFYGSVASRPALGGRQEFKLKMSEPVKGILIVQTSEYPIWQYGDKLQFFFSILKPLTKPLNAPSPESKLNSS